MIEQYFINYFTKTRLKLKYAFGFRVASLLLHLTTPHFLSAIFLIGWTACSVFENFLAVYLKLFLSFGKLYLKLFFLQYVPYFLGNMILNWVVWRCFDALKIWDSLCFLLPTLRRNSCLFSQTLLIPNLVSVNQTIIHFSDCCRYDSFAMCHDKCNINFCTSHY